MAFKRTLAQRLFNISRISHQTLTSCRISSAAASAIDPVDESIFRRFLRRRPLYQSSTTVSELLSLPTGGKLMERLRCMDIVRDRIKLDGLITPATAMDSPEGKLTAEDARKLLKVTQLEVVKSKLRRIEKSCLRYEEFVQICVDGSSSEDQGLEFAKTLYESGTVIVLGNMVLLRPDQGNQTLLKRVEIDRDSFLELVLKAIQGLMPVPLVHSVDPRRKQLEELEQQKSIIDKKAESMVRRELWFGLAYLVIQTAGFMRLTFWELSWDVMEPICFYVTSIYFMAGYAFFLGTAKEPSFEGFFLSRFSVKQKKLMKVKNFDLGRYSELRKACHPHSWPRKQIISIAPSNKNVHFARGL